MTTIVVSVEISRTPADVFAYGETGDAREHAEAQGATGEPIEVPASARVAGSHSDRVCPAGLANLILLQRDRFSRRGLRHGVPDGSPRKPRGSSS